MPLQNKSYTCSRKAQLFCRASAPASLDEAKRSVEFVASTEQPVEVWDWELCDLVPEVLRKPAVLTFLMCH